MASERLPLCLEGQEIANLRSGHLFFPPRPGGLTLPCHGLTDLFFFFATI